MRRREIPSLSHLEQVLAYDPVAGTLIWRERRSGTAKAGSTAGTLDYTTGGIAIQLDGRRYQAHHLAWYLTYKRWPVHQILFRDKNPANLRMANLYSVEEVYSGSASAIYARRRRERRAVMRAEHAEIARIKLPKTDTPVIFNPTTQKWTVTDPVDHRRIIKQFDDAAEAHAYAGERERILRWLTAYNRDFKLKPADAYLPAGTEPSTETYAEIANVIAYDPDNGQFYYRHGGTGGQLRADFTSTTGRQVVSLFGRYFSVAMLAWFLTHRVWPKPKQIGWRNGDNKDNRLSNLMNLKAKR